MPDKGYITTFTGLHFNLRNPDPQTVCIEDIAHHLSMCCRWAGAVTQFFSVAQHCAIVSYICPRELREWALMHDAAEAYIGDLTRPLKALVPDIREIEDNIMIVIAQKFGLAWPEPDALRHYDDQVQKLEGTMFIRHDGRFHARNGDVAEIASLEADQVIPAFLLTPMHPAEAEMTFLARYRKVFLDDDGL
jgi:hypothetical protein